jgi:exodeoxyribonuclease V beta subunit
MLPFDPFRFPLHGQRLIEASAGTGKTYSIALLFLRLLLERKLDVDNILVVTFTIAATEELRSRIRARLREALALLEEAPGEEAPDRLLSGIGDRREAATRLRDSLARMDESAVYTIHGFCQRMLQEHAFETGALFEIEFLESERPLRSQIVEDFWRQRFYSSSPEEAAWAVSRWQDPGGLEKEISGVLARPAVEYVPAVSTGQLEQARTSAEEQFRLTLSLWHERGREVADILKNDRCLSRNRKDGYCHERVEQIVSRMDAYTGGSAMPWVLPEGFDLLGTTGMQEKLIGKRIVPDHDFFTRFDAFLTAHAEFIRAARIRTLAEAGRFLAEELENRKRVQARIYYDDLIRKLDRALADSRGPELVRRIRSRFAVALVDEFQDTDPVQYRIVNRLFGTGPESALFMIGDPKQAIYSFRGGDIFTYMEARRETPAAGRFTMEINYRSTPGMVEAVNRLFAPDDSFIFAPDIVFHPIRAGQKADGELLLGGNPPLPLQAMVLEPDDSPGRGDAGMTRKKAEEEATRRTSLEIARLLSEGPDRATLDGENLAGSDLAVLVRTHYEAGLMQEALRRLGIASVSYSQDSVFEAAEAEQLYRVLFALLDLSDEKALRVALTTELFGMSGTELHALQQGGSAGGDLAGEIQEYQATFHDFGPTALFQRLLTGRQIVRRLSGQAGGERKLTNYLHLVELLQEASLRQENPARLVRWFRDQMHDPEPERANQQLRLESDENLVRIITIHKAKGLEYPVVFLPYLWRTRPVRATEVFTFHEPERGRVVADLGTGDPEFYRLAERERLAEDLRLLYVAVTRARSMCCFCWGRVRDMEKTALAWLLHRAGKSAVPPAAMMDNEQVVRDLAALNLEEPVLAFMPASGKPGVTSFSGAVAGEILQPKTFRGRIDTGWGILSYSQMTAGSEVRDLQAEVSSGGGAPEEGALDPPFAFPRGAAAGNCLHAILEQIDFTGADDPALAEIVTRQLVLNGIGEEWALPVRRWIMDILATPLSREENIRLQDIAGKDRRTELDFYFSMPDIDMDRFNRLLEEYSIPALDFQPAYSSGLMHGFIDLVFTAGGRYYIADYKSNYLGPDYEDYRLESLAGAVREHRYDLQYLIYTVALHRYLGIRKEGYSYEKDFGGVYYLFLRGMHPARGPAAGIFADRPPRALIEKLDLCFGQPEER